MVNSDKLPQRLEKKRCYRFLRSLFLDEQTTIITFFLTNNNTKAIDARIRTSLRRNDMAALAHFCIKIQNTIIYKAENDYGRLQTFNQRFGLEIVKTVIAF